MSVIGKRALHGRGKTLASRGVYLAVATVIVWLADPGSRAVAEVVTWTNLPGRMLTKENQVDYFASGRPPVAAPTNQWLEFGDALRTLSWSRATVRLTDWSQIYMKHQSRLAIARSAESTNAPSIRLDEGEIYFSSRGGGRQRVTVQTPQVRGTPEGTEFLVRVAGGTTEFTMFDG